MYLINKVLYLFIIILFFISCTEIKTETFDYSMEINENEIWGPTILLSRKNVRLVKARSEKLYKNTNEMAMLIGNVIVDFYNEEGNHISILYSDSAQIDEQNNNLYANGNVYIVSDSGYTLTTSKLIWDNRYEIIEAQDSVMFTHPEGDTLYGIGFESDADLERFKIFRPFGILREGI